MSYLYKFFYDCFKKCCDSKTHKDIWDELAPI